MPKKPKQSKAAKKSQQEQQAAKNKIVRLLEEAGWTVGRNDGEFVVTRVDASEDDDVAYEVHVQFNLNDLSIEQEMQRTEE